MLKGYLKHKGISIYKAAQVIDVPYSTLNDIVNHKVDIMNVRVGILYKLSELLDISMDELYELCSEEIKMYSETYKVYGTVSIKNKKYWLNYNYDQNKYREELYPVKKEATLFIEVIALWQMEKNIAALEMEKTYELCIKA